MSEKTAHADSSRPRREGGADVREAGADVREAGAVEILGIAGSLREGSYNRALIRAAREVAPAGVRWLTYGALGRLPLYDQDEDTEPALPEVARLRESIGRADALLVSTPEYNHSIPGVLKNAVDWASRPYGDSVLMDKPVAVIGASVSRFGAKWAQEDLRRVLDACQSEVLEVELAVSRARDRFEDGGLVDEEIREQLRGVVRQILDEVAPAATPALARCC